MKDIWEGIFRSLFSSLRRRAEKCRRMLPNYNYVVWMRRKNTQMPLRDEPDAKK